MKTAAVEALAAEEVDVVVEVVAAVEVAVEEVVASEAVVVAAATGVFPEEMIRRSRTRKSRLTSSRAL